MCVLCVLDYVIQFFVCMLVFMVYGCGCLEQGGPVRCVGSS